MADLAIIVDTKSLVDAKKKLTAFQSQMGKTNSILGLSRALNGVESNVKELIAAQKKGQLSSNSFKQGLLEQKKALVGMGLSFSQAKQKVDQLAAALKSEQAAKAAAKDARDLARAQKEVADAHERTRQRYVAGAAAQAQLKQAQRDLSAAYRAGVINIDEYRQALILLNQQNLGNRRSTNNLGVAMQQTGYQVGDFVVQVQSGQNPMVAFGQQATQLVGVLYLLPPATLAARVGIFGLSMSVSALVMTLGIAIPILTAIGAAYMRMKKDSDVAGKAADSLKTKIESLTSSVEDYRMAKMALSRGLTADQFVGREAVDEAKKNLDEAQQSLDDIVEGIDKAAQASLGGQQVALDVGEALVASEKQLAAVEAVTKATDTLKGVEDKLAEQQKKRFDDQKFNLDQELALQQAIAKHGADSSKVKSLELEQQIASRHRDLEAQRKSLELRGHDVDLLKKQVAETLRLEAANAKTEVDKEALKDRVKLTLEALKARKESIDAFQEQLVAQSEVLALLEIENQFTKDSSAYRAELIAQEVDRLNKLLDQKKITEEQAEDALALFEATLDVNDAIADSAKSATELANALKEAASAMSSLSSFGDSLDKALAVSRAKVQALKSGVDATIAGNIAGKRADLSGRVKQGLASGVPLGTLMAEIDSSSSKISELEVSETERKDREKAARESGKSGGGSNVVNINEIIEARKEQIAQDRVLLGLSGEQQAAQKVYYDLLKQNEKADIQLTEAELKGAADAIAAYEEQNRVLKEARQQQEALASMIAGQMGDAFMSIVDGTKSVKDAFKDMARAIIKELYQVFVVKRITGFIEGFVGGLGGSSLAPTSSVRPPARPFADGGVVGGPTYFPMAGGKTGLMGEAGPEAIMPLKRGANGKLGVQMEGGSQGNVVVNQSFNFSANGDDSVKKLIAQAAPKIAQMTKSSLLDDRRRGGSTKAAFG